MTRNWIAPSVALVVAVLLVAGCGTGFTAGEGLVTVDGLAAGQLVLCGANNEVLQISGSGFLSEHGNEVIVEFTALQGTPFNGEASTQVTGIALSDALVEALLPNIQGAAELTLTIILPGSNFGVSPPETIQLGGQLVGPFANFDSMATNAGIPMGTGNVTMNVAAPGVLTNDDPSSCRNEEVESKPWQNEASRALLFQNLSVIAPPGFSANPFDASPGMTTPTAQGGTVEIQADGSFVYEPPLGYEGNDTFTYWMEEAGRPDPDFATVSLTIDKVVWFIRDTALSEAAFVGTGRFSDPFDSLASFNNAQNAPPTDPFNFPPTQPIPPNPDDAPEEGDCIFIYDNVITTEYDEGIRLRDQQQLIGEGVGLFLNNTQIVPPKTGPNPNPVLTNTGISLGDNGGSHPVVTLGNENQVLGIDIDEAFETGMGYGDGIFGFDVSGPTFIDQVRIANAGFNGIHLIGGQILDLQASTQPVLGGVFQIGDPAGTTLECVLITDSGDHGIRIGNALFETTETAQFAINGLTVNVVGTTIVGAGQNGIEANDVNLDVLHTVIDDVETGINYTNNLFGQFCTLSVQNCNLGLQVIDPDPIRFRGIQINPFGDIQAFVGTTAGVAQDTFLYGGSPFTSGGGNLEIAVDNNTFETIVTNAEVPTVNLFGFSTTVTSLDSNFIAGNNSGEGMWFSDVNFDPGMGAVAGGDTKFGSGPAGRVEGTALRFFNCTGEITFTTLDIFQVGGDPSGIENTGTLVVNEGVKTINHVP